MDAYQNNQSIDYDNLIAHYKNLEQQYAHAKLIDYGKSDNGKPIYLFMIDNTMKFSPSEKDVTLLINNGIHPGEPCGIDASINFSKEKQQTTHR